jgi:DUF1680 family protein
MNSPFAKVRPIALTDTRWTRGFWADRFNTCVNSMVPAMGKLMTDTERPRFVGNFEVACGMVDGRHRGPRWDDGDFYKWLESAAAVLGHTKDAKLDAQLDGLIELIGKTQAPDGYIHTDIQIRQRAGEAVPRYDNPMDFEMYNMGHLITAACVHQRATGKSNLMKLALKAADFLDETFKNPRPEQARHGICPAHLMALVELYRMTGTKKYLGLAVRLLSMRDMVKDGDDDNQDRIPFRQQTTAHGHGVRSTYLYAGATDIYAETGDESLKRPLDLIWQDLVQHKLYITGGCGALYDGASPDGAINQTGIRRVHQSFGRDYQLPQSTSHNETCAAIGNLLWNWRMFLVTGESRFIDIIESTLYNSVLAGISLDGTAFFYTNTLRQLNPMPVELRWPRSRTKFMSCWCCPPNVVRTIAEVGGYAYAVASDKVYVLLYGGSELTTKLDDGTKIKLKQETEYPWDGKVRLNVDAPNKSLSIMLRIPEWAHGASVSVKGKPQASPTPGNFCEINRTWNSGDTIELNLPMPARLIEANPYVEEARNHIAVMRGPIVYCLESVDLPSDLRVLDVQIPSAAKFEPCRDPKILDGAVTLRGKARATPSGDWAGKLYRDFSPAPSRDVQITLVPYFAWDNRGTSEMSVWLPLAR